MTLWPFVKLLSKFQFKYAIELLFWRRELSVYNRWYDGKIASLYGITPPREAEKITDYRRNQNSVLTWTKMDFEKYLKHLKLHPERFKNMKVLDVGCGPVPYALVFRDCEMYGVDPLISYYRDIGYPMHFDQREMRYIDSPIEAIPVEDDYFDAVISVNALDHVDDFYKASEEINRVLKPDGLLVFEIHSHEPRVGHPWKITTEMIQESFGDRGITKVYENDYSFFYSEKDKDELLSVWSNAHMN